MHSYYLLIAQCPFFFNFILIFCSCNVFALPHSIRHSQCSCGTFTLTMLFIYCRLRYLLFFVLLLFPLWVQLSTYTNYLSIHSSTRLSLIASPYQMLALCPSKYAKDVVWSLLLSHAELCQYLQFIIYSSYKWSHYTCKDAVLNVNTIKVLLLFLNRAKHKWFTFGQVWMLS